MDADKLSTGEKVAGGLGDPALHLHVLRPGSASKSRASAASRAACRSRRQRLGRLDFIPIILVITIIAALAVATLRLTDSAYEPPISLNAIVTVLGGLSVLLILFRIIDPPERSAASAASRSTGLARIRHLPRPDRGRRHRLRRLQGDAGGGRLVRRRRRPPLRAGCSWGAERRSPPSASTTATAPAPPSSPATAAASASSQPPPPPTTADQHQPTQGRHAAAASAAYALHRSRS